jgi:hypothetical protein
MVATVAWGRNGNNLPAAAGFGGVSKTVGENELLLVAQLATTELLRVYLTGHSNFALPGRLARRGTPR